MSDTHPRLIATLVRAHKLDPARLGLDTPLASLGIDSLGTIELLWDIEDQFQIKLPAEPPDLQTVGDVVRHIDGARLWPRGAAVSAAGGAPP